MKSERGIISKLKSGEMKLKEMEKKTYILEGE